ncbi:hypothetical protein [Paenibacillus ginsengarvi]|uniref:Glycosyl hydrolase family 32 N-terminal domain-containing protein n=1 Tax=Paenibacillus ginsengarvi TaxID=400777 RepID=A0A3B0B0K0_9BACL|nr:hypothetical protein [Paenibacillus ginsengarvi]RKN66062.1 hypothetical protein D7M11_31805 [Paenibacillus ginsengarvi]
MKSVVEIGTKVEMFVDEWLIEEKRGLSLKLHPPRREEIVLSFDQPWEGKGSGYVTVIQEQDKIRMYYRGIGPGSMNDEVTCYAESTDGIHFVKPQLGLFEYEGSTANNIVWRGRLSHNFSPFLDRSPHVSSELRYKAVGGIDELIAFGSADGIHWRKLREEPILTDGDFDSLNVVFWDVNAQAYRCYSRIFQDLAYRAILTSTSTDFCNWGKQQLVLYNDLKPMQQYYTNSAMLCPEAEHIYMAFPMRFVPERKKLTVHPEPGISDTVMMTSRDGLHWDRTFMEAWCRAGLDPHNWSDRTGILSTGSVLLNPDEFSFYIQEHYRLDDSRLRRITVRKHGFGSIHAGFEQGEWVSRPFVLEGNELLVNYSTSAVGYIRFELQDENGRPLDGFRLEDMEPMYGDEIRGVVTWGPDADIELWRGRPVRIRMQIKDADLFSLKWNDKM